MNVEKETIYHFTCKECKGWFSIATMEDWQPTKLYCPYCGIKDDIENNPVTSGLTVNQNSAII